MSSIIVFGDVHGDFGKVNNILNKKRPSLALQVGDFGYGWDGFDEKINFVRPVYFADGNHENFDYLYGGRDEIVKRFSKRLDNNCFYMPRGSVLVLPDGREVLFAGGAGSIDKGYRIPFVSWWPQEDITFRDMKRFYELKEMGFNPDIIISHTGPSLVLELMGIKKYENNQWYNERMLDEVFGLFKPRYWYFGHFHKHLSYKKDGTTFHCLSYAGREGFWSYLDE